MIRWPTTSARPRPGSRTATVMVGVTGHDATEANQVQEGLQRPDPWACERRHRPQLWCLRHEDGRARPDHGTADRGGPPRDHAPSETRRPGLDPDLPGRAGV